MKTRVVLGLMLLAGCGAQPATSIEDSCEGFDRVEIQTGRSLVQTTKDAGYSKIEALDISRNACLNDSPDPQSCLICWVAIVDEVYR